MILVSWIDGRSVFAESPDPALEGSTDRASYAAFERTRSELQMRISLLLHLLARPQTTRRSPHAAQ
jgi:hypothetical protein